MPDDIDNTVRATLRCSAGCWAMDYRGADWDVINDLGPPLQVARSGDQCPQCGAAVELDERGEDHG